MKSHLVCLALAALLNGCQATKSAKTTATPPSPVAITGASRSGLGRVELPSSPVGDVSFSEEAMARAKELVEEYADGAFLDEDAMDQSSLPAFLYIAKTSDDPRQRAEAATIVEFLYNVDDSKEASDPLSQQEKEFYSALYPLLSHEDPSLVSAGLRGLSAALAQPEPPRWLLDAFFAVASESRDPGLRYDAVAGFSYYPFDGNPERLVKLVELAENEESEIVIERILDLVDSTPLGQESTRQKLKPMLLKLSTHDDPIVRGEALSTLALWAEHESLPSEVKKGLDDQNAYVRAKVIEGMVATGKVELLELIGALESDEANAIPQPKMLLYSNGSKLKINYRPAYGETVGQNARRAKEELEGS